MQQPKQTLASVDDALTSDLQVSKAITQPQPMRNEAQAPMSHRMCLLASYLEIPFMHKRLILICTLLGMLLGWVSILVWPRTYESQAKMIMRIGRESVSLDPSATTSSTLMMQKTQEEEIVSALEILSSRRVAERVVDDLGADAIMSGVLARKASDDDGIPAGRLESWRQAVQSNLGDLLLKSGVKDDISRRELAVMEIQSTVWSYSPKKSTIIAVESHAKTPLMAQMVVESVIRAFLDEHLQAAHTVGSLDFFTQQSMETEKQLNELSLRRSQFMRENAIISIDVNRNLIQDQLSAIDLDLVATSGELLQATSEIADLEIRAMTIDDEIVASKTAGSDSTWSGMRQQVYELELQEQHLAASLTDENPKLQRLRQQLAGAQEILAKLRSERVDESTTPNPVKINLSAELQRQQTRALGLKSVLTQKQNRRIEILELADELLAHERNLTQMDRDISVLESSLRGLREKWEEARVIEELHEKKISNVSVFQPATFVERAISPQKKPMAIGFAFLGLMSGIALSWLRQVSSPAIRTTDDVENQLRCNVVANIPRLRRMASPRLKDQKKLRQQHQTLISEVLLSKRLPNHSRGRSLGVIGVDMNVGASTLAVNLALASSVDCHMKTVLVDADSHNRSISKSFNLNGVPGLVELLGGVASHDECLQRAKDIPLDLVASAADSNKETLTSGAAEIAQALQAYVQDSDLVIVDLPAASQPDHSIALAQYLDCVVVVVESEKTLFEGAERLLRRLSDSDAEVIGIVLNKTQNYLPIWLRRFVAPQS